MCVVNSNPRRRHRAAYLAPARRQDFDLPPAAPATPPPAPPQLDPPIPQQIHINITESQALFDSSQHDFDYDAPPKQQTYVSICTQLTMDIYRSLVDFLLLTLVMIMSFFLYDVEITIVKSDEEPITRHSDFRGSRVILRNDYVPSPTRAPTTTRRGFEDSVV